jgi:hypothetical protein
MNHSDDLGQLISTAKHLIEKVHDSQRLLDSEENQLMIENLETNADDDNEEEDESIVEKFLEYEKRLSSILSKKDLVLLLRTYKKLSKALNESNSRRGNIRQVAFYSSNENECEMNELSVNLQKNFNLFDSNRPNSSYDSSDEGHKASIACINEIKSTLLKGSPYSSQHDLFKLADNEEIEQENQVMLHAEDDSTNLIITGMSPKIFTEQDFKAKFEHLFLDIDTNLRFIYFKSFKRCRIECHDFMTALLCKFELDNYEFLDSKLKVFLSKVIFV